MGVDVLGPLRVDGGDGVLGPRDRVVLAVLVTHRGELVDPERIADALWPDQPPATWLKVVQGCIARLRKVLGREAIETVAKRYRLLLPASEVDAARFEATVVRVEELRALSEPDRAAYLAEEALGWWRGRPLPELEDWDPGRLEAERLEELRRDLEEAHLDALLQSGRLREVFTTARVGVLEAPLRERRWALLATAQYQAGRQGEALETLRRARSTLADGLGLDPGPELVALEGRILRREAVTARPGPAPETAAACPYQGLVSYDEDDADRYFGRERDVDACLQRLAEHGAVVVAGPSGSGKSSLVRAGLAARLRRDGHRVVVITPGARPSGALGGLPSAGSRSATPTALVVDQCEEALTLCADPVEQHRFFAALVSHAERAPLVLALRADRLGDLVVFPTLTGLVQRCLHLLTRMTETDLRAAIERPARQAGLLLEPGLVDLLLRDVEDEPGALPLLSHALRQTWLRREGRTLTVDGYRASGGIRGAVAQTAEQVYERASPEQRSVLRDLLLRLVVPGPDGEPVRGRLPRRMVASDAAHERLLEELVAARLLISDERSVELAHEALIRAWPRLQGWLDDDVEGRRILNHLAMAADAWDGMGRPDSELYRGARLTQALEWRDRSEPDLTETEGAFLAAAERQTVAEQDAGRHSRRTLLGGLTAAAIVATILATVAVIQATRAAIERDNALAAEARAEEQAERAEGAAAVARSRELTSQGVAALEVDPALAKLLALTAVSATGQPTVDGLALLHRAYAADPVIARYDWPGSEEGGIAAHLHPDGERVLVTGVDADPGDLATVHDFASSRTQWSWEVDDADLGTAESRFSPDGDHVLLGVVWTPRPPLEAGVDGAGVADGAAGGSQVAEVPVGRERGPPDGVGIQVRSATTGELEAIHDVGPCGGRVAGVSATHIAVVSVAAPPCAPDTMDNRLLLVDRATHEQREVSSSVLGWAPMSGDGRLVAFTEAPSLEVGVVEVATGRRVSELDPFDAEHGLGDQDGGFWSVADLNIDGSLLVTGTWARRAVVWDVATGQLVTTFAGHGGEGFHVFGPDGDTVYTTGRDGAVWHWDARRGDVLATYPAVGGGWISAAADDRLVVPTTDPRGVVLLEASPRPELWHVEGCDGTYGWSLEVVAELAAWAEFCNDGQSIGYVLDLPTQTIVLSLPGHHAQHQALSPDGTRLVRQERVLDPPRELVTPPRIRDSRTGDLLVELDEVCTWDRFGDLTDDGCGSFPDEPAPLWNWRFVWSPDGARVVAIRHGGMASGFMVWDADTGQIRHLEDDCEATDAIFSDDGAELLVACRGQLLVLETADWSELQRTEVDLAVDGREVLDLIGPTADGRWMLAIGEASRGAHLHWFDARSLNLVHTIVGAHDGAPKSYDLSPDRDRVAVGSSDGMVRVWDVTSRRLVHEFVVGNTQVQGLAFVDDDHLAIGTEHGGLSVYTLDPDELVEVVRRSLTRGFSPAECDRYPVADDCVTLTAASP
jgi:DNA-binding SARP family transcriptional activator/WD40 repeat protein